MLTCRQSGRVVWLTLDAPHQKNKLSTALLEQLRDTLDALRRNHERKTELQAIVIHSAASTIFAAGADMRELLRLNSETAVGYAQLGQSVMDALADFPVPSYALVGGPCFGGGFDLALACQRIWVAENATFCHPGAFLGLMTGFGGTVRLPQKIEPHMARHMLLTAYRMKGLEAFRLGLAARWFGAYQGMITAFCRRYETRPPALFETR
ncbi:enoyl-CoA hydratase/isomerase family protein [Acanthopleuribacter pedis]|uniref:Enoyl-CoA hydratase/isomerase family protein n=1 Tax=Acanthopleuribacter pedis TaxID=442870 RepID=A0A8J7U2C6_9BACT|nr:enoyl-CoA hydratase/isomerase family protein [Acanthopleuribacter pedis]MBO1317564.1 enoyl-CoA hydratase/isomerase family protein [Acanthopleuribacter pedis]